MASHDYPTDFPIGAPLTDAETPRAFLPGATTPSARQLPPVGLPLQAGRGPFLENDMRQALATRPADEATVRTYRDDLANAMREDHEAIAPEPQRPPVTVAVVFLGAAMVFAAILGAWL